MAHPKGGYRLPDNRRVVGVTTVLGRFKESGGLLWWAFEQGKAAERGEINSLYDKRDEAADLGTVVHNAVEHRINSSEDAATKYLNELEGYSDDQRQMIWSGFEAYLKWERMVRVDFTHQEMPLVHPEYGYGGCPDAAGIIDGGMALLDWKTSNSVYGDYLLQLAAYWKLCEDGLLLDGYEPLNLKIDGGFHLCRFSKEQANFSHHYFSDLSLEWEQFKLLLQVYQNDKIIKKKV